VKGYADFVNIRRILTELYPKIKTPALADPTLFVSFFLADEFFFLRKN